MPTTSEIADQVPLRYASPAVAIHWIVVALLLTQVWLGFTFADMARGPARAEYFTWHKTVGATILVLTLIRLGYRLMNPPPPYPESMPDWRRTAAVWSHRLLYLLMIALPLTGLTAVSGVSSAPTTPLAGGIPLPTIPGVSKAAGEMSAGVHEVLVYSTIALLIIHIGAALYEQFAARDGVAYRMPPFRPRDGGAAVIAQGGEGDRDEIDQR
ncbi:MAG TPA: cytochrome b [Sphingomicrobium sp.]|nr:cytochrome b [Sphingomicrobium sp.]